MKPTPQERARQLRARHKLLMNESDTLQRQISTLSLARDAITREALQCSEEAEKLDPTDWSKAGKK